ncbi:acyl-CoA Delta(11) desaturase-like [Manduca sexta]|uniref:acyl-CoA Delta(11) desaturase-like n=1 Tax=Manduca sexta TaxID=7130 RepID=UPI00188EF973|nr:acyl-CoA Delta(11) desaturase-like [Manduca sexta]
MLPNFGNEVSSPIVAEESYEKLIPPQAAPRKYKYLYANMIYFAYWHIAGLYGIYLAITTAKWATIILAYLLFVAGNISLTAGAHRLWAHKSYKAKLPLQILLMLFSSIGFQNTVFTWVKDHRMHHKYSDTDADPHNATRGFFYSHVGWLMVKRHPEAIKRGKSLDMSDIYNNPVLKFQKKYAIPLITTVAFVLPTIIPMYFWDESLNVAWHMTMLRYIIGLNTIFLVNSFAHMWGYKPYDKNIAPTQSYIATLATLGEGFHNYHHAFPWNYRASELGNNYLNLTTKFIDFFAWIGWAYDLKSVPEDLLQKRMERTGDGTNLWGRGDKNMKKDHVKPTDVHE